MSRPWAEAHVGRFQELCRIPSPSLAEAAVAKLLTSQLDSLGIAWKADEAGTQLGGDQGNILCLIPGVDDSRRVLLAAHLDTVPPGDVIAPVLSEGSWRNSGDGILGVDNKAAVAALLTAAAVWAESPPAVSVVLAFTVAEEISLLGSRALALTPEKYTCGFVFDHPTPIGSWVAVSPAHHRLELVFIGRASHAGVDPEGGASAISAATDALASIKFGRIDEETTTNAGTIHGGSAINVVPAQCTVVCEVRSMNESTLVEETKKIIDATHGGAQKYGCSVDVVVTPSFRGYRHDESHIGVLAADKALTAIGIQPEAIASAGGSDANVFEEMGIPTLNLGDGSTGTHTPDEQITNEDLLRLVELVLGLPAAVADAASG